MRLTQEWLNRPMNVDFRFRARLRPLLFGWWLVGKHIPKVLLPLEQWSAVCLRLFNNDRKLVRAIAIAVIG